LASLSSLDISLQSLDPVVSLSTFETSVFISEQHNIAIISAMAFLQASKLSGSSNFELCLHSLDTQVNSAKLAKVPDLSNIFSEYHKFTNVFSKTKAKILTSYYFYDLQINLE